MNNFLIYSIDVSQNIGYFRPWGPFYYFDHLEPVDSGPYLANQSNGRYGLLDINDPQA